MNRINEYKIEPGVYVDEHDQKLVVLDIVNYMYNGDKNLPEAIENPLVILRPLEVGRLHARFAFPLSIFQQKFKPYEKTADTATAIPDGMQ
jgi:hypothetical protein